VDATSTALWLADWRRRVADLYADVRAFATEDPVAAWRHWVDVREALFREHPMSPLPRERRSTFRARHFPYDPGLRFEATVEPARASGSTNGGDASPPGEVLLPSSGPDRVALVRAGTLVVPFSSGTRRLPLLRFDDYAGGLLAAFGDATNGGATYGAGRYILDTAKGADLGGDPAAGTLVLDFNFAFHPSCAWDPRWACPLAPPEARLDLAIEGGEQLS
jgi:uncharacterized protein (DUF1684 family)